MLNLTYHYRRRVAAHSQIDKQRDSRRNRGYRPLYISNSTFKDDLDSSKSTLGLSTKNWTPKIRPINKYQNQINFSLNSNFEQVWKFVQDLCEKRGHDYTEISKLLAVKSAFTTDLLNEITRMYGIKINVNQMVSRFKKFKMSSDS